jgi:hypothetical protein
MKAIFTVLIVLIGTTVSYSQNDISIKFLEKPSNPLSDSEHYYLFELKNNTNKDLTELEVSTRLVSCNNSSTNESYKDQKTNYKGNNLNSSIFETDKITPINQFNLGPKAVTNFYLMYSRNKKVNFNTANCFEIVVTKKNGKGKNKDKDEDKLSNVITVERLIPDPNEFN